MLFSYDSIIRDDIIVCQPKENGFRFGCDSAILAWFTKSKKNWKIADVGSGSGVISALISKIYGSHVTAFELQEEMFTCLNKTVELSNISHLVKTVHADIRTLKKENEFFDAVVCNPPYRNINTGKTALTDVENKARFTITMNIEDLAVFSKKFLKHGGKLFFSYDADLLIDALYTCKKHSLEPKRILSMHKNISSKAKIVFVECSLSGGTELKIEPPLFQQGNDLITKTYNDIFSGSWI